MTLLLLAGIVVLAAVQLATVIYYVKLKLGMEQEKQVQIVDGLLTGLTVCLILRLEGLWMQCGLFVGYLMLRYVAEVYKGRAHGEMVAVAKKKLPLAILGAFLGMGVFLLLR